MSRVYARLFLLRRAAGSAPRHRICGRPGKAACPHMGKVIAVVSGKGSVGKSLVTSSLAAAMRRMGKRWGSWTPTLPAPPSPPPSASHQGRGRPRLGIYPETKTGIEIMSLNLLTENETDPVVWRGPVIAGAVKQFWTDVIWGRRGLPVCGYAPRNRRRAPDGVQSLPVDGIVVSPPPGPGEA